MKRIKTFIPLIRKNRNIFIKNFINDFIDALIGFLIGSALEALFNLEIIKAIVFIIFYIVFSFFVRMFHQKINDKNNLFLKKDRGIKKLNERCIVERGLFIIVIIILSEFSLAVLFMLLFLTWKILYKHILKENLNISFSKSNL